LWDAHEIGVRPEGLKRLIHPEVGTAIPGSESYEKLQLLSVIGARLPSAARQ
jgi:hypothetical protein